MIGGRMQRLFIGGLASLALVASCAAVAAPAQAEFDDPLFLYRPLPPEDPEEAKIPPPAGEFEGPCGLAVSSSGNFYVSDFYNHVVDFFGPSKAYGGQITEPEPLVDPKEKPNGGPCGLAFAADDTLYVNVYHRSVVRFPPGATTGGTVLTGAGVDSAEPTGVAVDKSTGTVYVNDRTHLSSFSSAGASLGTIGVGQIGDAHGLAVSEYPATAGRVYVPDAATETVKVFNPTTNTLVATIDGHDTPNGKFTSLRDSAIAVDRVTGEVYVADNLQPVDTERAETTIHVFDATGAYEGRLKYNVVIGWSAGLAVDNSATPTQGRVYATTENSERGAVFAYPPGAATDAALPAPPLPQQQRGELEDELGGEETPLAIASVSSAVRTAAAPEADDPAPSTTTSTRHARHKRKLRRGATIGAGRRAGKRAVK
jgi:DNA-binding beta-propeller fold protein YncE